MNELKFPFKFKHIDEPDIFTANLLFDDRVKVSWVEGDEHHSVTYDISIVEHSIDVGYWKVVDEYGKEQDPDVVIKQSEVDAYIDEINMLRELVAELTSVEEEQQFKPVSEMTREDWQQAVEECWEFETRYGDVISAKTTWSLRDAYPVRCSNGLAYTIRGYFWDSGKEHEADIIKRIK
jgi:hypothetical protein